MICLILPIIGVLLVAVSGVAKSVQDKLAHHFQRSIFNNPTKYDPLFWNPNKSWMNKYEYDRQTGILNTGKERFKGSTTIFVWLTDAWHAFQAVYLNSSAIGYFLIGSSVIFFSFFTVSVVFILSLILSKVVFQIFYQWILEK